MKEAIVFLNGQRNGRDRGMNRCATLAVAVNEDVHVYSVVARRWSS